MGFSRRCEKLVKSGVDLSLLNIDSCTPAHGAAFYKRIDVLELLLDNKIDVNVKDISGKNVLHLLCKDQSEELFSMVVSESEANLSERQKNGTEMTSVKKNYIKLIERLLTEYKMDPNEKDSLDFTPLMYACEHNNLDLVKLLVEHRGDIHFSNRENVTCMLLAVVNSCPLIVEFLIKNGFDVKKNTGSNVSYITDGRIFYYHLMLDMICN